MANVWTLTCLAGLWGFLLSAVGFILNCFPARDRFEARKALKWGGALLICFVLWVLGMAHA